MTSKPDPIIKLNQPRPSSCFNWPVKDDFITVVLNSSFNLSNYKELHEFSVLLINYLICIKSPEEQSPRCALSHSSIYVIKYNVTIFYSFFLRSHPILFILVLRMFSGTIPDLGCKTYPEISSIHPCSDQKTNERKPR